MGIDSETAPQTHADLSLAAVLAEGRISCTYQPVVELDSGAVVAFEALSAGPAGSGLETPRALFAEARRTGLLTELDMACRVAAFDGARKAGLHRLWTLFVNTEPDTAASAFGASSDAADALHAELGGMRVIVELTERALVANPVELLHLVRRIRARGWGIALDDVGAERASLALLPLLRPDVIKLDMRLVQQRTSPDIVEIVGAVNAEAERSGSIVLAEGIETAAHLEAAKALGATHGQGWYFAPPAALPSRLPVFAGDRIPITDRNQEPFGGTPFELAAATHKLRTAGAGLLQEFSRHLERQARRAGESALLLATFQHAALFSASTRARYGELVKHVAFLGVLGEDIGLEPLPGIRGGLLGAKDPLVDEWTLAVIAPHYAATLVAREHGRDPDSGERRFSFVFSHDRHLATEVATYLISRISPLSQG